MLENGFYYLENLKIQSELESKATIRFNADHPIFKGHFPDFPVVPGVATLQIVKEITEKILNRSLQMISADHIKFLSPVIPVETSFLDIEIVMSKVEDGNYLIDCTMYNSQKLPVFKLKKALYKQTNSQ